MAAHIRPKMPEVVSTARNSGVSAMDISFKSKPPSPGPADFSKLVQPKKPQFHQSPMARKYPAP